MAVFKRICNTLNRNSNNSITSSPELKRCRQVSFSFTSYLEPDAIEVQFSPVKPEAPVNKFLQDDFVMLDIKNEPLLTASNIVTALSNPCMGTSRLKKCRALSLPSKPFTETQYWISFMQAMREIGNHCLKHNLLLKEDFKDQEPFLFIGLPALAIMDIAHRSFVLQSYPIVFSNGTTLNSQHSPSLGPIPYKAMEMLQTRFKELKLTAREISFAKIKLLYSSGEDRDVPNDLSSSIELARMTLLNAFIADIISISIDLTQLAYFKDNFETSVTNQVLKTHIEI